ncbi:hypothetical protein [Frigoriglobus tundricola]|uniref:Uncharacterized protein n=1 Tax=Frigoriglobus tundricola TaxID=2774151 RepID=A0A6M5YVP1_9BACT|nr:hypothetical protein [Frigoriglobus tundricola]QJW97303.1 hypothetical protein FTUN_4873 [Frigoriglobus tundricola]
MTETEWLACADPTLMLEFLKGRASDRKLRLFICACCRRIWPLLTDQRSRHAVDVGENFADGLATDEERSDAEGGATQASGEAWACVPGVKTPVGGSNGEDICPSEYHPSLLRAAATQTAYFTVYCLNARPWEKFRAIHLASRTCRSAAGTITLTGQDWAEKKNTGQHYSIEEFQRQSFMLLDVFGNPFRSVAVEPSWRTSTVLSFASQMYDSRNFSLMPILADALQDAGCDNPDILNHCRQSGEHVRGCWMVDLIMGKS